MAFLTGPTVPTGFAVSNAFLTPQTMSETHSQSPWRWGLFPRKLECHTLCISTADFSCDTRKWFELTSEHTTASVSTVHMLSSSGFLMAFYESVCLKFLGVFFLPRTR